MKNIKQIMVMHEESVTRNQLDAVASSIINVLRWAGVSQYVRVSYLKNWKYRQHLDSGLLVPHNSFAWYIQEGVLASSRPGQINVGRIMSLFWEAQRFQDYYIVMVLANDMYSGNLENGYIAGTASAGQGMVISVNRFSELDFRDQRWCIKALTIHHLGHVFGLIPENREKNVVQCEDGLHCANLCSMRQSLLIADWLNISKEIRKLGGLCPKCLRDLYRFFRG